MGIYVSKNVCLYRKEKKGNDFSIFILVLSFVILIKHRLHVRIYSQSRKFSIMNSIKNYFIETNNFGLYKTYNVK